MDKSREDFENWAEEAGALPWGYLKRQRNPSGGYSVQIYTYMWAAWQASRKAGKAVAYMTHHGSAVSPDDFKGGEEEMLFFAKVDGWTPLISGITVKGDE